MGRGVQEWWKEVGELELENGLPEGKPQRSPAV
jgi:hypothetical protein